MRLLLILLFLLFPTLCIAAAKADMVLVDKSDAKLYLLKDGEVIRKYSVAFGENPVGHKRRQGDERTPEGDYVLDYKKADSSFHRAIHISYPNAEDIAQAKARGVDPGGLIMIHGQPNGMWWLAYVTQLFNWTNGCIAVTDAEMDEIWVAVDAGTPITIRP